MTEPVCSIEEFTVLAQRLEGLTVALPWKGYGSAIFLELGELTPIESKRRHHAVGEACISVEWDWRVENDVSVLYGSSNSRPEIERGIGRGDAARCEYIIRWVFCGRFIHQLVKAKDHRVTRSGNAQDFHGP